MKATPTGAMQERTRRLSYGKLRLLGNSVCVDNDQRSTLNARLVSQSTRGPHGLYGSWRYKSAGLPIPEKL